ncbi:hypothetical protein CALVIDRAFT_594935 [Calocera viscosa TUFC12733]|uniref:Uncharacterized protein n=1 Tax=Calocera viscosa (strain TUFC12733) TaxID=1330018 RepID=A0A167RBN3_CALVF|nr:hypothetical protein CALVIDRAFT_594935 [Calocera viscosa TUFC12733]
MDEDLRKSPITDTCTGYGKWKHRPTWEMEVSERLRLEEREAREKAASGGDRDIRTFLYTNKPDMMI